MSRFDRLFGIKTGYEKKTFTPTGWARSFFGSSPKNILRTYGTINVPKTVLILPCEDETISEKCDLHRDRWLGVKLIGILMYQAKVFNISRFKVALEALTAECKDIKVDTNKKMVYFRNHPKSPSAVNFLKNLLQIVQGVDNLETSPLYDFYKDYILNSGIVMSLQIDAANYGDTSKYGSSIPDDLVGDLPDNAYSSSNDEILNETKGDKSLSDLSHKDIQKLIKSIVTKHYDAGEMIKDNGSSKSISRTDKDIQSENIHQYMNQLSLQKEEMHAFFEEQTGLSTTSYELTGDSESGNYFIDGLVVDLEKESYKYESHSGSAFVGSFIDANVSIKKLYEKSVFSTVVAANKVKKVPNWYLTTSMRLLDMLDINFDPSPDTLNNLRTGQIDTNKLVEGVSHYPLIYKRIEEKVSTRPFSVCVLLDLSGSMAGARMTMGTNVFNILFSTFYELMDTDRMFFYGHTGNINPKIYDFNSPSNPVSGIEDFYNRTNKIDSRYIYLGQNYDGPVMEKIHHTVRQSTTDDILMIVISDGEPAGVNYGGLDAHVHMRKVAEKSRRDKFVIGGIGLNYRFPVDLYRYYACVKEGHGDAGLNRDLGKISRLVNTMVKTEFQD